jgi:hypothetical protein
MAGDCHLSIPIGQNTTPFSRSGLSSRTRLFDLQPDPYRRQVESGEHTNAIFGFKCVDGHLDDGDLFSKKIGR